MCAIKFISIASSLPMNGNLKRCMVIAGHKLSPLTALQGGSNIIIFCLVSSVDERPRRPLQKPQQRKKDENEMLRGGRDQIRLLQLECSFLDCCAH